MIDFFTVITGGGLVLFEETFAPTAISSKPHPVDALIQECLVDGRDAKSGFVTGPFALNWAFANDLGVIFVVVYQHILQLTYVEELLSLAKTSFVKLYGRRIITCQKEQRPPDTWVPREEFSKAVKRILRHVERKTQFTRSTTGGPSPARKDITNSQESTATEDAERSSLPSRGTCIPTRATGHKPMLETSPAPVKKKSKGKAKRVWDDGAAVPSKEITDSLDFSSNPAEKESKTPSEWIDNKALGKFDVNGLYQTAELSEESSEPSDDDLTALGISETSCLEKGKDSGGLLGAIKRTLTGSRTLVTSDFEKPLQVMQEQLINKNVAQDIAKTLTEHAAEKLMGKTVSSWRSISKILRESLAGSLEQILTPGSSIDLLKDIRTNNDAYVIVFVGVNGVGKSTNLSKVAFWLLQNQLRVLISACDTFRSGAVEQLRIHAMNLGKLVQDRKELLSHKAVNMEVELFERGYGKDAAKIAQQAIQHARRNKFDVVLIDTAGRMQNNEPLMRALGRLVSLNKPNRIIFVGEALVGNEAVNQVAQFNRALAESGSGRQIDGMILTKFDTIDNKVGAAVSMAYTTGKPIIFLGTGQTYTDLKRMNVNAVVKALMG